MKTLLTICLLFLSLLTESVALSAGMSTAEVERELGKATSTLEIGSRTTMIFADGRKLEFTDDALVQGESIDIPTANESSLLLEDPANQLKIDLPSIREHQTITQSSQDQESAIDQIGQSYDYSQISENLTKSLEEIENSHGRSARVDSRDHLRDVLIGGILEIVITIVVLQIAFSISGFPFIFRQIALLALATALAGAMLEYVLHIGLINPIRVGLSFLLLTCLIRQMTDVREWATAIKIALIARLVSLGLMWVAFAGIMVLFGL